MNKKKHEFPHAFVILFAILVLMAICTYWPLWAVQQSGGRRKTGVDADSQYGIFPVGFMGLFQSIPQGIQDGAVDQ
ncbi:MAG: hypothetical protein ACLTAF_06030 [Blautia coccoides]